MSMKEKLLKFLSGDACVNFAQAVNDFLDWAVELKAVHYALAIEILLVAFAGLLGLSFGDVLFYSIPSVVILFVVIVTFVLKRKGVLTRINDFLDGKY